MLKMIAKTAVAALSLALAAQASNAHAASGVSAPKPSVAQPAAKPLSLSNTTWGNVSYNQATRQSGGVSSGSVSKLTYNSNGTFTDVVRTFGGNGSIGSGGSVIISGQYKQLSSSEVQLKETSDVVCVVFCTSKPTSLIGKTFDANLTPVSPGVVQSLGVDWTQLK
jgi:hypothetical protein